MKDLLIKIEDDFIKEFCIETGDGTELMQGGLLELNLHSPDPEPIQKFLHQSLLQVIERCADRLDKLTKKKEQVNGFQPYSIDTFLNDDGEGIFFDGWDDGRDLLKIDIKLLANELRETIV